MPSPFSSHLPELAQLGHIGKLEKLLKSGADANARQDATGNTALHNVMEIKDGQGRRMVAMLVAHGADLNARNYDGYAPLHHYLRLHKPLDQVAALIEAGADLGALDPKGSSPVEIVVTQGHEEFFDLLLKHGAPVDARFEGEWTALHRAALFTSGPPFTQRLLEAGADPLAQDRFGRTPMTLARGVNREVLGAWRAQLEQTVLRTALATENKDRPEVEGTVKARPRL